MANSRTFFANIILLLPALVLCARHDFSSCNGIGAVSTNSEICAKIGRDILSENGTAADAMIAMMFCEGIASPHTMGLGGGFVGVVYTRSTKKATSIIAREVAPYAAYKEMFQNSTEPGGIRSVGVPGELRGYAEMHAKFGRLPWKRLVQPAIDMCNNGYEMTPFLSKELQTQFEELVEKSWIFRRIYWNEVEDRLIREGELVRQPTLGQTLELIAAHGPDTFYEPSGTVAKRLIQDINEFDGILTHKDLQDYRVEWLNPGSTTIDDGLTVYSPPLPTSGDILIFIMNVLEGFLPTSLGSKTKFYHRIVETFKYAFGMRAKLGDKPEQADIKKLAENLKNKSFARQYRAKIDDWRTFKDPEHYGLNMEMTVDRGTTSMSVLAPNGDAIAVTSTVNAYFGSKIISPQTGFVLNDQMDDFSIPGRSNIYGLPPSPANFIEPGKRPMSSMCPTIVTNKAGDVEIVVGAAGGPKIITAVALTLIRYLERFETMKHSVASPRLHHQLLPMIVLYEPGFDKDTIDGLSSIGHIVEQAPPSSGFGAVSTIVFNANRFIEAVSDVRRNGSAAIFCVDQN